VLNPGRVDDLSQEEQVIKGIKFVSIAVRDQDRALEFYTKKLGMRIITDAPFDGTQRWIELGIPRADTKLVLFTMQGHEQLIGKFQNVTFVTDDVEATVKELKARGVEFIREQEKEDWGTSACFKDQDGNIFVLSTP
jgi:catechol 2,3-dioxygenase-like lactoylglutathione lyase family enzyme